VNLLLTFLLICVLIGLRYERLDRRHYGFITAMSVSMVVLYLYVTRFL
jgi:hypothetical protein